MGSKESKFLEVCPLVLTLVWQTLICSAISPGSQRKNFGCYHSICYITEAMVMLIILIWSIILYRESMEISHHIPWVRTITIFPIRNQAMKMLKHWNDAQMIRVMLVMLWLGTDTRGGLRMLAVSKMSKAWHCMGLPGRGARKTKERSRSQTELSGNSTAKRNGFSGERGRQWYILITFIFIKRDDILVKWELAFLFQNFWVRPPKWVF